MAAFSQLSQAFHQACKTLSGANKLTEKNIQQAVLETENALIAADCAVDVALTFCQRVRDKALGSPVKGRLSPEQVFKKLLHDELVHVMATPADQDHLLHLAARPPAIILLAGLQGAGKTTTAARLGLWIQKQYQKSVMLVSTDVYRPAAMDQLARLAEQASLHHHPASPQQSPTRIVKDAIDAARRTSADVLIVDTAGRTHIDEAMMTEISQLHQQCNPTETLLVIDSMTGQIAAETASAFHTALPKLSGVILTKTDGDSRGGAVLSVCDTIQQPIKFIGTGEKLKDLDTFDPERMANQLLGMGDIVGLVREVEHHVDQQKAEKTAKKMLKGQFTLDDLASQYQQMQKLDLHALMKHMPGAASMPPPDIDTKRIKHMLAVIQSMTRQEKQQPEQLKGSQKRRIAEGSGTSLAMVLQVIKQYKQMKKMAKKMKGGAWKKQLAAMQGQNPDNLF